MYENVLAHLMAHFYFHIDIHFHFTTPKGPNITPNDPPPKKKQKRVLGRNESRKETQSDFLLNFLTST